MIKCFLLIASCSVFGSQLAADSIPKLTETSGTAFAAFIPGLDFSISTPSFDISWQGQGTTHGFARIGQPIASEIGLLSLNMGFGPVVNPNGAVRIGGQTTYVYYTGGGGASADFGNALVPSVDSTLTFPAVLTGGYGACVTLVIDSVEQACPFGDPSTDFVANVSFALPGILTVGFSKEFSPFPDGMEFGVSFSTIPEPSTAVLVFLATATLGTFAARRKLFPN